jgi:hypothetical protein
VGSAAYRELGGMLVWQGGINTLKGFGSCDITAPATSVTSSGTSDPHTICSRGGDEDIAWPIYLTGPSAMNYGSARCIQKMIHLRSSFVLKRYLSCKAPSLDQSTENKTDDTAVFADFATTVSAAESAELSVHKYEPFVSLYILMKTWTVLADGLLTLSEDCLELQTITSLNDILKTANYFFECGRDLCGERLIACRLAHCTILMPDILCI